jgi:hypothetical protein
MNILQIPTIINFLDIIHHYKLNILLSITLFLI